MGLAQRNNSNAPAHKNRSPWAALHPGVVYLQLIVLSIFFTAVPLTQLLAALSETHEMFVTQIFIYQLKSLESKSCLR